MKYSKDEIFAFLSEMQRRVEERNPSSSVDLSEQDSLQNEMECFYVYDFIQNDVVFHAGMQQTFGHQFDTLTLADIFDKYHPEDADLVKRVIKATVDRFIDAPIPKYTNVLSVSYRFRQANMEYSRILSKAYVFDTDDSDLVKTVLVKYTDISFLDHSDIVEWTVNEEYLNKDKIWKQVYSPYQDLFTPRQKQVVLEILKDKTNNQIAETLHISKHTVTTHRKHIFNKSNCHNKDELLIFCKRYGIV